MLNINLFVDNFKQDWQDMCQNLQQNIGQKEIDFAKLSSIKAVGNIIVLLQNLGYNAQNSESIKTKTLKKNL